MARSSQPQQDVAAGSVFRVFGSLVMGPSWIWIFMKINIFLFEDLKRQDFLDPYFSDTCMWVQDPSKWGYPWFFSRFWIPFFGSFLNMDLYENKYISIWGFEEPGFFGSIFFRHVYVGLGPFKVGVSIISLMFMWVLDPHTSVGKIWIHKILALQTLI